MKRKEDEKGKEQYEIKKERKRNKRGRGRERPKKQQQKMRRREEEKARSRIKGGTEGGHGGVALVKAGLRSRLNKGHILRKRWKRGCGTWCE